MSIITGGASHRKGLNKSLFITCPPLLLCVLTARQLREFALPGAIHPVDCPGCEHGVVPVGRRVWRGICKVGCGWFCDRGI
jgi:hypothetical protein